MEQKLLGRHFCGLPKFLSLSSKRRWLIHLGRIHTGLPKKAHRNHTHYQLVEWLYLNSQLVHLLSANFAQLYCRQINTVICYQWERGNTLWYFLFLNNWSCFVFPTPYWSTRLMTVFIKAPFCAHCHRGSLGKLQLVIQKMFEIYFIA